MDAQHLIPPPEALGIPTPAIVFVFLMNLTLVLHFILMGYVFTATLAHVILAALAREGSVAEWMLRRTEGPLPVVLSFTITLGVAPLLFVQVLYPQFFYSGSILIGFQWFAIVPVLMLGFYLIYVHWGGRVLGRRIPRWCDVAGRAVIFGCIAFILLTHTVNSLVALYPEKWRAIQAAGGNFLALHEPVLLPRLLHNFFASLVIGSVWLVAMGLRSQRMGLTARERNGGQALTRIGVVGMAGGAAVQVGVGLWLTLAESNPVKEMLFSARPASILWMVALCGVIGILLISMVVGSVTGSRWRLAGLWALLFAVLGGMFSARQASRDVHLSPYFSIDRWSLHAGQWSSFALFAIFFVAALAVLAVMIRWMIQGFREPVAPGKGPSV